MPEYVTISTGTKNEFDLTASVLLMEGPEGDGWIDSIYDADGEDAIERCRDFIEERGCILREDGDAAISNRTLEKEVSSYLTHREDCAVRHNGTTYPCSCDLNGFYNRVLEALRK